MLMVNIDSLKELSQFTNRFFQTQIVDIKSLKLSVKDEKITELSSLEITSRKKSQTIYTFFKQFFPQDGGYKYEYQKGRVMISNCFFLLKVDFQYQEQQSIFIQDFSSKQNIQNKTDSCHIQLCFKQKAYLIFSNGRLQNEYQINLNFEDKNDLASLQIDRFQLVESFLNKDEFQNCKIFKQIESRYVCKIIQESTPNLTKSFSTQNISFNCYEKMQDYLQKYQFAFATRFKIGFNITLTLSEQLIFNLLFQDNDQLYKQPHIKNLCLNQSELKNESYPQILSLKTIKYSYIQRKQLSIEFQQQQNLFDFLQHYLDTLKSRDIVQQLKLSYMDQSSHLKYFDSILFYQGLKKINFYDQISKLSLNLKSQISAQPFIQNLQSFQSLNGLSVLVNQSVQQNQYATLQLKSTDCAL
ncbi:hypothetical protein ABPG72_006484 [Tetrahymena utriculariae]